MFAGITPESSIAPANSSVLTYTVISGRRDGEMYSIINCTNTDFLLTGYKATVKSENKEGVWLIVT